MLEICANSLITYIVLVEENPVVIWQLAQPELGAFYTFQIKKTNSNYDTREQIFISPTVALKQTLDLSRSHRDLTALLHLRKQG